MQSKWIGMSKIFVGSAVIMLNSFVGLPFIPAQYQPMISGIVSILVAIDRVFGTQVPLTIVPK